jgi:hypothetical protein
MEKIHTGELICQKLKEEGRTKKWLAGKVHCDASCLCKTLKKRYIDTELLLHISLALQHDFFRHFSNYITENQNNI